MSNGASDATVKSTAVPALLVVVAEGALASSFAIVPALRAFFPAHASWMALAVPLLVAVVALGVACMKERGPLLVTTSIVAALAFGASVAGLAALSPSLRGIGVAFAAPLIVGEMFAAGAWIARGPRGAERSSAALSLGGAALSTCVAAFVVELIDVEIAPLAVAIGGVCAQGQLAVARIGEARAAWHGGDASTLTAARIGGAARVLVLAALGRFRPQEGV